MCGIAGIYAFSPSAPPADRTELRTIRDHMTNRGPDGHGEWFSHDGRVALGHRRLAIIDPSERAAQPMHSVDGQLVITFNGEIYNYRELRQQLEAKGHVFRSQSDTEVLLQLYADKGEAMLPELRGMFAFALWDARNQALLLARDPLGIKPLYYADDGKTIRFASQVKALLSGGKIDTTPEPAGHAGFYLWGHVPEPYTLYKGIRALSAGACMQTSRGKIRVRRYFSLSETLANAEENPIRLNADQTREALREALLDSVNHHLIADVPVGFFLSAGLDSTTLVALASESKKDLATFTLGFREFQNTENDEVPLAVQVAHQYRTSQTTCWVSRQDFQGALHNLLQAMDQPTTDGVNSYFVSKEAAGSGLKVAVSGLGGDELFGSYSSFGEIPRLVSSTAFAAALPGLGKGFRLISAPLLKRFTSPKYAGLLEYGGSYGGAYLLRRGHFMPWELPQVMDPGQARQGLRELQTLPQLQATIAGLRTPHFKVAALEMSWYMRNQLLRDIDWASMTHSLEVRVPLVDVTLLKTVAPMIAAQSVQDKEAMTTTPAQPLPPEILHRGKTGFSIPVRQWQHEAEGHALAGRGLRPWACWIMARWQGLRPGQ